MYKKVLFVLILVASLLTTACTEGAIGNRGGLKGSGTEEDPYLISTFEDLEMIGNIIEGYSLEAHYKLINDIDAGITHQEDYLSEIIEAMSNLEEYTFDKEESRGFGFYSIGGNYVIYSECGYSFKGVIDGQGHTINNLFMRNSFINYNRGIVKNLNFNNLTAIGIDNKDFENKLTGAIVNDNYGKILNCHVNGKVVEKEDYIVGASGIAGSNGGSILHCSFTGEIEASGNAGGIVGEAELTGETRFCYFKGKITGSCNIGGIAGKVGDEHTISNNYVIADIVGKDNALWKFGGIVGCPAFWGWTVTNNYFIGNIEVVGKDKYGAIIGEENKNQEKIVYNNYYKEYENLPETKCGIALSEEELKRKSSYKGFDFEKIWDIKEGESYPFLREKSY